MRNRTALVTISGLILGIFGAVCFSGKAKSRQPSSLTTDKKAWVPAPVGKHLALLKVEISNPADIPESGGDQEVTLVGRILVNQKIQGDLSYAWTLPEDVQVAEGQLSDSLANIQAGQVVEVKLTVTGFNKEKQRLISLQASSKGGSEILGGAAVVASRPEDTWESVAPDMKKSADALLETTKSIQRK